MHWIEDADAVSVMPAVKQATTYERQWFQEGNPQMGKAATVLNADFMNMLQDELLNLVEGLGITPEKGNHGQLLAAMRGMMFAAGGILPWDRKAAYDRLPDGRLHHIVWASDNKIYVAEQPSGPGVTDAAFDVVGPQDPTTTTGYWLGLKEYIAQGSGGGGSGGGGNGDLVYPGAFGTFFLPAPPENWRVRNGQLIMNASIVCPQLCEALQTPEMAFALLDEATWQSWSAASGGIGGVPRFVFNAGADTVRLPDTRGDYAEDAGFNGLGVGGQHRDAIRNITGYHGLDDYGGGLAGGAFVTSWSGRMQPDGGVAHGHRMTFDASRVVPTAAVNRPRAFGVLGCVYVGSPSA